MEVEPGEQNEFRLEWIVGKDAFYNIGCRIDNFHQCWTDG